jgi:hypothetical protein
VRSLAFCALLTVASMSRGAGVQADADYVPFRVVASGGTVLRVDIGAQPGRARLLRLTTVLATAMLIRGDDGVWRLNFREFDYAQLC